MVSHKHKCIFVHIPKVAGTSIEQVFLNDLELDFNNRHALFLGVNNNIDGPRRISHLTLSQFEKYHFVTKEQFNEYFKFTFVRNPVNRLYSTYKYLGFDSYLSFDNFIKKKLEFLMNSKKYDFFMLSQIDYLKEIDSFGVDFIGKFENIKEDFEKVKVKLNLNLELPHKNKSNHNTISRMLKKMFLDLSLLPFFSFAEKDKTISNESKKIILKYYEKDFDFFDYNF